MQQCFQACGAESTPEHDMFFSVSATAYIFVTFPEKGVFIVLYCHRGGACASDKAVNWVLLQTEGVVKE